MTRTAPADVPTHGAAEARRTGAPDLNGAATFTASAERVVAYLRAHTPLTDWSVSRVSGGEQIHVHVQQHRVPDLHGRANWDHTFCSRMSQGASHVSGNTLADPDYSDLQAAQRVGAYAGYTIRDDQGDLFGVLCGARPEPLAEGESVDEELVRLLSELLSTQLSLARGIDRERRSIAIADALAHTDALTGALNRRGWDRVLADAQERVDAFGDPVAIAIIDLDGLKAVNDASGHAAGDLLIARTAETLRRAATDAHRIARIGGDEFAILANGVTTSETAAHFDRFRRALASEGISASLGAAAAVPTVATIAHACSSADAAMYVEKQRRANR